MHRGKLKASTAMWGVAAATVVWATIAIVKRSLTKDETLLPAAIALPNTRFLSLPGGAMAYLDEGDGTLPVILVHGFAGSMLMWRQVQSRLAAHARVLALDLWGFGASERPPRLAPDDWVQQLIQFMDVLGIPQAVLVGHSLGGRVVLTAVAQHPTRVRGIVLVSSDGVGWPTGFQLVWAVAHTPFSPWLLRYLRHSPRLLQWLMQNSYGTRHRVTRAEVDDYMRPMCVQGSEEAWSSACRHYPGSDLGKLIPQIHCPTALLWGSDDRITPLSSALRLQKRLPHADLLIFPNAGHMLQMEDPDRVADFLRRFLSQV